MNVNEVNLLQIHEMKSLEYSIAQIMEIASGFGLDYYPMRYEVCPAEIIYTFGAYGMPSRFSHWSFGKSFHRMKTQYDLGLSKIYELVINSNPCYAFLLDGNSLIQNKLIVAHVLAHCDFFKNNARFSHTNRNMVETMSAASERISQYGMKYGTEAVETFLDAVLAIQEHVDPSFYKKKRSNPDKEDTDNNQNTSSEYTDLWSLENAVSPEEMTNKRFPAQAEKDILSFIETYSQQLEPWQRDILTMLRDEMLYFWPQMETKIMNEGWASYWHIRILREMDLTSEETLEFAKLNSAVVQPSQTSLNPYYLGLKIFEDIERRWDKPTDEDKRRFGYKEGMGREKMFEVREFDSDTSFIRSYLTKELVEDLDLYIFEKKGAEWKITDKTWETTRDQLVYSRVNGGFPYLYVEDGSYLDNGELYLKHAFEGNELDLKYIERTLPYVVQLWGKPVHLQTTIEDKSVLFSHDGKKANRRFL